MLIEYIKAIIYGAVEGITEWLPVSSTGHLILLGEMLELEYFCTLGDIYRTTFDVVIQLAAVLAVVFFYKKELIPTRKSANEVISLWKKLICATLPAYIIGLLATLFCKTYLGVELDALLFTPVTVAVALIVYGVFFILSEHYAKGRDCRCELNCRSALGIGFFQTLAIIPGTSRSGATILGATLLGLRRRTAAEFSFLAAVPVIFSASLLKIAELVEYILSGDLALPTNAVLLLLTAAAVAFAVSLSAMRFLTDFLKRHTFISFGIYRILLGIAVLLFM